MAEHMTRADGIRVTFTFDEENRPVTLVDLDAYLRELGVLVGQMRELLSTSPIDGVRLESLDTELRDMRHGAVEAYAALVRGPQPEPLPF